MCYTPMISLSTAIFEFLMAFIMLLFFSRTKFSRLMALFVFLLGVYQFTEFMVCSGASLELWTRAGFITYTFLPAIGLNIMLSIIHRKSLWIYIPPVIFSLIALLSKQFVIFGFCEKYFVTIQTIFFNSSGNPAPTYLYWLYYLGYLFAVCWIAARLYRHERKKEPRRVHALIIGAVLVSIIPAWIFIIFLPSYSVQFPSIYCEFAIFTAVLAFLGSYIAKKERLKIF